MNTADETEAFFALSDREQIKSGSKLWIFFLYFLLSVLRAWPHRLHFRAWYVPLAVFYELAGRSRICSQSAPFVFPLSSAICAVLQYHCTIIVLIIVLICYPSLAPHSSYFLLCLVCITSRTTFSVFLTVSLTTFHFLICCALSLHIPFVLVLHMPEEKKTPPQIHKWVPWGERVCIYYGLWQNKQPNRHSKFWQIKCLQTKDMLKLYVAFCFVCTLCWDNAVIMVLVRFSHKKCSVRIRKTSRFGLEIPGSVPIDGANWKLSKNLNGLSCSQIVKMPSRAAASGLATVAPSPGWCARQLNLDVMQRWCS